MPFENWWQDNSKKFSIILTSHTYTMNPQIKISTCFVTENNVRCFAMLRYDTIRKSFVSAPLQINIHYESAAQLAVKKYPSETYIDETKVLELNKWVLSLDLKTVGDRSLFFKYAGSAFHAVGPETANPRGPKVLVNVRGMMRSPRAAERCDRSAPLSDTRESISERYGGASPRKQRKTSRQSLNEIRCRIGSQCNLFRMSSEMRSYFFFCRTSRAAARSTDWSWPISWSPTPASRLLQ